MKRFKPKFIKSLSRTMRFEGPKFKSFSEYFELALDRNETQKASKFAELLKGSPKSAKKVIILSNTFSNSLQVISTGLFILPGGKLGIQSFIKTSVVRYGIELFDSAADLTHSDGWKLKLASLLLDAFLFLDKNVYTTDLFDKDFAKEQLNKLMLAVNEYSEKQYEILLATLNYLNMFIHKTIQKDPEFFLNEDVQNSLLNLIDVLVEKSKLDHVDKLLNNEKSLVDENLYNFEVLNYHSIINGLLLILRYSDNTSNKVLCYNLLNKFSSKQYSELVAPEDAFCTIDGIQVLLSDLTSKNEELKTAALVSTCLLFKNDNPSVESQAIKLLKTRMLSNLIQNFKDPSYQVYLASILQSVNKNQKKQILLTQSELFKVEKERLKVLSEDKTVTQNIRELLKSFLKTT